MIRLVAIQQMDWTFLKDYFENDPLLLLNKQNIKKNDPASFPFSIYYKQDNNDFTKPCFLGFIFELDHIPNILSLEGIRILEIYNNSKESSIFYAYGFLDQWIRVIEESDYHIGNEIAKQIERTKIKRLVNFKRINNRGTYEIKNSWR